MSLGLLYLCICPFLLNSSVPSVPVIYSCIHHPSTYKSRAPRDASKSPCRVMSRFIEFVSSIIANPWLPQMASHKSSHLPSIPIQVCESLRSSVSLSCSRAHVSHAFRRSLRAAVPLMHSLPLTYDLFVFKKQIESALSLAQLVLSQDAESSLRQMSSLALLWCTERSLDDGSVSFRLSTRRSSFSGST
jgi:hypothetical protein